MSNWNKVLPSRAHRERSQPASRKKFGLLEKHSDYKLRAIDYHKKEDTIKLLTEKAQFKNEDEFYFQMHNSQMKNGIHINENQKNKKIYYKNDKYKMKNEDINYLHMKIKNDEKKIETLLSSVQGLGDEENDENDENEQNENEMEIQNSHLSKKRKQTQSDEHDEEEDGEEDGQLEENGIKPKKQKVDQSNGDEQERDNSDEVDDEYDELDAAIEAAAAKSNIFGNGPKSTSKSSSSSTKSPSVAAAAISTSLPQRRKHVIFVDSSSSLSSFSPAQYFNTDPSLVSRSHNRLQLSQLSSSKQIDESATESATEQRLKVYEEIEARLKRKEKMKSVLNRLQREKNLLGKGQRKKIVTLDKFGDVDESKTLFKWKLERKK